MASAFKIGISLKTQIYGLIIAVLLSSFLFSFLNSINTTRHYLQTQMSSHAQDTANSLGLSISPYLDSDNYVIAETMAQAIFDSGYYQSIRFIDNTNKTIFSLENATQVESVPHWFIDKFTLRAPTEISEVNSGWIIAGRLEVTTHTAESYRTLWNNSKHSFYNTLVLLLISLAIAYLILRAIFKPLKSVEEQANSVTHKRFITNENIPVARELRTVTRAMNAMISNLQVTFNSLTKQTESLTEQLYKDSLTGLGNRKSLENYFNSVVGSISEDKPLSALMISLPSLANINKAISYHDGDAYVLNTAEKIKSIFSKLNNIKIFRLNGGTFVVLAPYDQYFLNNTCNELNSYFKESRLDIHKDGYANTSMLSVSAGSSISDVLSSLDTHCIFGETIAHNEDAHQFSVTEWRKLINDIISSGEIDFKIQPVKSTSTNTVEYFEVFALFIKDNKKINNCHLFSMAETLNLTEELDKKLIRDFVNIKEKYPEAKFAINLSQSSLYSTRFLDWLRLFSDSKTTLKNNLIFEFHESSLLRNVSVAASHIDTINEIGISICIEHFGVGLASLKYLQGLDITYVKIDGSHIQEITDNAQSQFFIQTVNTICHGFGIKTLASLIEDRETMLILQNLGCDGLQGMYINPPSSINTFTEDVANKKFTLTNGNFTFSN